MAIHSCQALARGRFTPVPATGWPLCSGREQLLRLISFQERQSCHGPDTPTHLLPHLSTLGEATSLLASSIGLECEQLGFTF